MRNCYINLYRYVGKDENLKVLYMIDPFVIPQVITGSQKETDMLNTLRQLGVIHWSELRRNDWKFLSKLNV